MGSCTEEAAALGVRFGDADRGGEEAAMDEEEESVELIWGSVGITSAASLVGPTSLTLTRGSDEVDCASLSVVPWISDSMNEGKSI
jgi:hypothetical protein